MTTTPQHEEHAVEHRSAPVSPRPNRLANAQPPAKAAPNTSAAIRIAALTTVIVFCQLMRCLRPEPVGSAWSAFPCDGAAINTETGLAIKPGLPGPRSTTFASKPAATDSALIDRATSPEPKPAARRTGRRARSARRRSTAIKPEHFRPPSTRALAAHRAEIDAIAADAARAELRQHRRGAGALRAPARPGVERLLRAGRRAHQRGHRRRSSATWRRCSPRIGTRST